VLFFAENDIIETSFQKLRLNGHIFKSGCQTDTSK